ncbi:MAG: M23 family peptidase, partial [Gramella sp.]|nr:M23 family peptidase [Christiangramia sp.]
MRAFGIFFIFIILSLFSCTQMEKAGQLITGLSPREEYQKQSDFSNEIFQIWEERLQLALKDSLEVDLPYTEAGDLKPRNFAIYSYQTYLMPGEVIEARINTDSIETLFFSGLYKKNSYEKTGFQKVKSGDSREKILKFEIQEKGLYKLIFQPEIEAHTAFTIEINKSPIYTFPVSNGKNADIGSYWGDNRDAGKRQHKGIDIFAPKGTPV